MKPGSSNGPQRSDVRSTATPPQSGAPGALTARVSLTLADVKVLKLAQKVQSSEERELARSASRKAAEGNLAILGNVPSMKKSPSSLSKCSSKIIFPGVLPAEGTSPSDANSASPQQFGASGRFEGKFAVSSNSRSGFRTGKPDSDQTVPAAKHVLSGFGDATQAGDPGDLIGTSQALRGKTGKNARDQARQAGRSRLRALRDLDIKRRGGKGLLEADVAPDATDKGPRKFVYERMRSHLRDAAATAADAWAAGMAEGLARFRNKNAGAENKTGDEAGAGKEGKNGAKAAAGRSVAFEKRRMQRQVANRLGLNANAGNADGEEGGKPGGEEKESPEDIMQKLWTVENLLTVETEWFSRKQKQTKPEGQEAPGAKKNSMPTFRRRNKMAVNHKKNFDLTDVYSAVQDGSSFDFNEEKIKRLREALVCRYPIDLEKLPEEVAEILEVAATDMEAQLASSGQQATHTALEALALAALDMSIVDATIASISEQVPYPTNSVVPGLLKMNMVRFVYWHKTLQWRLVLRENWLHSATQPDAVARDMHLSRHECLGILATAYDLSGQAQRDINSQEIVFAQDIKEFEVRDLSQQVDKFCLFPGAEQEEAEYAQHKTDKIRRMALEAAEGVDPELSAGELQASQADEDADQNAEAAGEDEEAFDLTLEGDEVVSFRGTHPLEGTVFYDQFKDTGHSIERRRDGKDNVVELLRDVDGKLLAIAFPVWDAVSGGYIREVTCIENAVAISVPLRRKAALRRKKEAGDAEDEAADSEEESCTQVQYVPDGRGGFFEIIDSESQGGMFAVSAVAAEHLQQCLEGTAAPFDESNTMFADGIQAQDVAKMREEAASKVAAQPATVELLQSLLEAALQSEGGSGATSDDASARSSCRSQPQSAEGSDTGLMLRDPREGGLEDGEASGDSDPEATAAQDDTTEGGGATATGAAHKPLVKKKKAIKARGGVGIGDADRGADADAEVDCKRPSVNRERRSGGAQGGGVGTGQSVTARRAAGSSESSQDGAEGSSGGGGPGAAASSPRRSGKGTRSHSKHAGATVTQHRRSQRASRGRRTNHRNSSPGGVNGADDAGSVVSDASGANSQSCSQSDGEEGGESSCVRDKGEDCGAEEGFEEGVGAAGGTGDDCAEGEGMVVGGGDDEGEGEGLPQVGDTEAPAEAARKHRRRKKKRQAQQAEGDVDDDAVAVQSSDSGGCESESSFSSVGSVDQEAVARAKRWSERQERKKKGGLGEPNADDEASMRARMRSRGSASTSVNLRGVRDRNRSQADGFDSESSSDQGSLRFDQFLDAQGSDDEGGRRQRLGSRAKSSVSMSQAAMRAAETQEQRELRLTRERMRESTAERGRQSAIELSQRPAFNPYGRANQSRSMFEASSEPYQDPDSGMHRDADAALNRRSMLSRGGASAGRSMGGGSQAAGDGGSTRGGTRAVWKSAGRSPKTNWTSSETISTRQHQQQWQYQVLFTWNVVDWYKTSSSNNKNTERCMTHIWRCCMFGAFALGHCYTGCAAETTWTLV